jgi:hypothetical protein
LPTQTLCVNVQGLCWPLQAGKKNQTKNNKNKPKKTFKVALIDTGSGLACAGGGKNQTKKTLKVAFIDPVR